MGHGPSASARRRGGTARGRANHGLTRDVSAAECGTHALDHLVVVHRASSSHDHAGGDVVPAVEAPDALRRERFE
jgi:hypothetical protein